MRVYVYAQICWSRALLTGWVLLLVQLQHLQAVPIGIDKTKVKETEKKPDEPPASVVKIHMTHTQPAPP